METVVDNDFKNNDYTTTEKNQFIQQNSNIFNN